MTTSDARRASLDRAPVSADELFRDVLPLSSADDLACDGVFDDGEVEDFLVDPYSMRQTDRS